MGKVIIKTNEDFIMNKLLEEKIQRLLIEYELEKGLKFTAGITQSDKLQVEVYYKQTKDLDNVFKFKRALEKLILFYTNSEDEYTFRIGVGYGD